VLSSDLYSSRDQLINKWNNLRHPSSEFSAFAMGRQKSRGLMLVINEAGQFDEFKSAVFVFPRKRKDAIADASSLKQALKKTIRLPKHSARKCRKCKPRATTIITPLLTLQFVITTVCCRGRLLAIAVLDGIHLRTPRRSYHRPTIKRACCLSFRWIWGGTAQLSGEREAGCTSSVDLQ